MTSSTATFLSPDHLVPNPESLENILDYYVFRQKLITYNQTHSEMTDPVAQAQKFLEEHWEKTHKTRFAYQDTSSAPSTHFCLALAEKLREAVPADEKGVAITLYSHLLSKVLNVDVVERHGLGNVLITDNGLYAVAIGECLKASVEQGVYCYLHPQKNIYVALSYLEIERIKNHSVEAAAYFWAVGGSHFANIDIAFSALIDGLYWSLERDKVNLTIKKAVIDRFTLFLDVLANHSPLEYAALMCKQGNWGVMQEIYDRLVNSDDLNSCACCMRALISVKNSERNQIFFESRNEAAYHFNVKQIKMTQIAFEVASTNRSFKKNARYKTIEREGLLVAQLSGEDLKEIFRDSSLDEDLCRLWKLLNSKQKNQLAEVLDEERLLNILRQQDNPHLELDQATTCLEQEIKNVPEGKDVSEAREVLNQILLSKKTPPSKGVAQLTESAHSIAVLMRDPNNEINFTRSLKTAKQFSAKPGSQVLGGSMKIFLGSALVASAVSSCILSGGVTILPVLLGLGGMLMIARGSWQVHDWRRPPLHKLTVATLSFLKKCCPVSPPPRPENLVPGVVAGRKVTLS